MIGWEWNLKDSFSLVSVNISNDLIWYGDVENLAVIYRKKLKFLFNLYKHFWITSLATLYEAVKQSKLEYFSYDNCVASRALLALLVV